MDAWTRLSSRAREVDLPLAQQVVSQIRASPLSTPNWPETISPVQVLQKMAEMLQIYYRHLTVANSAGITDMLTANQLWGWFEPMHAIFGGLRATSTPSPRCQEVPWDSRAVISLVKLWAAYFDRFSRRVDIPLASQVAKMLKETTGSAYNFEAQQVLNKMAELMKLYSEELRDTESGKEGTITEANRESQWFVTMREVLGDSLDAERLRNGKTASPSEQSRPPFNRTNVRSTQRAHGTSTSRDGCIEDEVEFIFVAESSQEDAPRAEWTSGEDAHTNEGDEDDHADVDEREDVEKDPDWSPEGGHRLPSGPRGFPNLRNSSRRRVKRENNIANVNVTNGLHRAKPVNSDGPDSTEVVDKTAAAVDEGVKHRVKVESGDIRTLGETHQGAGNKANGRALDHNSTEKGVERTERHRVYKDMSAGRSQAHNVVQKQGATVGKRVTRHLGSEGSRPGANKLRSGSAVVSTQVEDAASIEVDASSQGVQDTELRITRVDGQEQIAATAVDRNERKPMVADSLSADPYPPKSTGDATARKEWDHNGGTSENEDVCMAEPAERRRWTQNGNSDPAVRVSDPADKTTARVCMPNTERVGEPCIGKQGLAVKGDPTGSECVNPSYLSLEEICPSTGHARSRQPERPTFGEEGRLGGNADGCASVAKERCSAGCEMLRPSPSGIRELDTAHEEAPVLTEKKGRRYLVGTRARKTQSREGEESGAEVGMPKKQLKRGRDVDEVAARCSEGDREGGSADENLENVGERRERSKRMRRTMTDGVSGSEGHKGKLSNSQDDSETMPVEQVARFDLRRREMDMKRQELELKEREIDVRFREMKLKELELKARKEEASVRAAELDIERTKRESARTKPEISVILEENVMLLRALRETAMAMEEEGSRGAALKIMSRVMRIIQEGRETRARRAGTQNNQD